MWARKAKYNLICKKESRNSTNFLSLRRKKKGKISFDAFFPFAAVMGKGAKKKTRSGSGAKADCDVAISFLRSPDLFALKALRSLGWRDRRRNAQILSEKPMPACGEPRLGVFLLTMQLGERRW